jgi:hypothetical protein
LDTYGLIFPPNTAAAKTLEGSVSGFLNFSYSWRMFVNCYLVYSYVGCYVFVSSFYSSRFSRFMISLISDFNVSLDSVLISLYRISMAVLSVINLNSNI